METPYWKQAMKPRWQWIVDALRKGILSGRLPAGSRVLEAEVARDLGVSRAPVREALRHLELEGLLVSSPYRGTHVASLTEEEVTEVLVPIRILVESMAVRRAIVRMAEPEFKILEALVEDMRPAAEQGDAIRLAELDVEFHRALMNAADSESLNQIWSGIVGRIQLGILRRAQTDRREQVVAPDQHGKLVVVLREGNPDKATVWLEEHIRAMLLGEGAAEVK